MTRKLCKRNIILIDLLTCKSTLLKIFSILLFLSFSILAALLQLARRFCVSLRPWNADTVPVRLMHHTVPVFSLGVFSLELCIVAGIKN